MNAEEQATREQLLRRARERLRAVLADQTAGAAAAAAVDEGVRGDVVAFLARLDAADKGSA